MDYFLFSIIFVIIFSVTWYLIYLLLLYKIKNKQGLLNFFEFNIVNSIIIGIVFSFIVYVFSYVAYVESFKDFEIQITEKFEDINFVDLYDEINNKTGSRIISSNSSFYYLRVQLDENGYIEDINITFAVSRYGRGIECIGQLENNNTISFTYDKKINKYREDNSLIEAFYNLEKIQIQRTNVYITNIENELNINYDFTKLSLDFSLNNFEKEHDVISEFDNLFLLNENNEMKRFYSDNFLGKVNLIIFKYESITDTGYANQVLFAHLYSRIN